MIDAVLLSHVLQWQYTARKELWFPHWFGHKRHTHSTEWEGITESSCGEAVGEGGRCSEDGGSRENEGWARKRHAAADTSAEGKRGGGLGVGVRREVATRSHPSIPSQPNEEMEKNNEKHRKNFFKESGEKKQGGRVKWRGWSKRGRPEIWLF